MMKDEFEKLIGRSVPMEEYKVIEMVYTWHPAISSTEGKKQMQTLYTQFGMSVINAMVPVAKKMIELDEERRHLEAKLKIIGEREQMLSEGDFSLEEAIDEIGKAFKEAEDDKKFSEAVTAMEYDNGIKNLARKILEV